MHRRPAAFVAIVLILSTAVADAQQMIWQHTPRFEDTIERTYLWSSSANGEPAAPPLLQLEPAHDPKTIVRLDDGAYVMLPVNGGPWTDASRSLVPPSWNLYKGLQVARIDTHGRVLWQHLLPGIEAIHASRRTSAGGLALILGTSQLLVFDAAGEVTSDLHVSRTCGKYALPDTMALTDEDAVLVGFGSGHPDTTKVCAIDLDGTELDHVSGGGALALQAGDYRRAYGFLVTESLFHATPVLSLRTGTRTHWSVTTRSPITPGRHIAPNGDVWIGDRILRLDGTSLPITDTADETLAWLPDDSALRARPDAVMRTDRDGGTIWLRSLGPAPDGIAWEIGDDRIHGVGAGAGTGRARTFAVAIADGAMLADVQFDVPSGSAMGRFGGELVVAVGAGEAHRSWSDLLAPCEALRCPRTASIAAPAVTLYRADDGAQAGAVDRGDLALMRRTAAAEAQPRPMPLRDRPGEAVVPYYVYDGATRDLHVAHIAADGTARDVAVVDYARADAADAAAVRIDGRIHVVVAPRGPDRDATPQLVTIDMDTWESTSRPVPYALLPPIALRMPGSITHAACSMSIEAPLRWTCLDATQTYVDVDVTLDGVPMQGAGMRMLRRSGAHSVTVINDRGLPFFLLGEVDAAGEFRHRERYAFAESSAPNETIRGEEIRFADDVVATALVYGGPDVTAVLAARFDSDGTLLWQQRIDGPIRTYPGDPAPRTPLAVDGDGNVYVALNPRIHGSDAAPARVCRFTADGQPLGCLDAAHQGRVTALLERPGGTVDALLSDYETHASASGSSTVLRSVEPAGFGRVRMTIPDHLVASRDAVALLPDRAFATLNASRNGPLLHGADVRFVAIDLDRLFDDGFE